MLAPVVLGWALTPVVAHGPKAFGAGLAVQPRLVPPLPPGRTRVLLPASLTHCSEPLALCEGPLGVHRHFGPPEAAGNAHEEHLDGPEP